MASRMIRAALRGGSLAQVRYVDTVRFGAADGKVREVYRAMEHDFGVLAPPIVLHTPSPPVLTAAWAMLREALLVPGREGRAAKEAVAAAVSRANECPFCVHMHTSTFGAVEAPPVVGAELTAVAVLFHYLNRMVNVFLGDVPLPPGVPGQALGTVSRVLNRQIRAAAREVGRPGEALGLLAVPPASGSAAGAAGAGAGAAGDLAWAASDEVLNATFQGVAAVFDALPIPPSIGPLVDEWAARERGMSRSWVEQAVAEQPAHLRSTARLALLTAWASYQVDEGVVASFREDRPSDRALIEVTAWAAFRAARREGAALV